MEQSEEEVAKKFGIDIEALKREQLKLAKELKLKDSLKLSEITKIGAIASFIVKNRIISTVIVCDKNSEILEQQYFVDKLNFPYIYGFRAYRELNSMIEAINKLNERPDIILVSGHGITHPRLGLASHLSLAVNLPTIGVSNSLFEGNKVSENGEDILLNNKKVGKVLQSKEKSNPLYISPGNRISIESAYEFIKSLVRPPHKMPEPLHLSHKYAKEVQEEINV